MSRARDELWDALELAFGAVRTSSERGRRNKALRELREAHATPEEIAIAVAYCRATFTHFTEPAICANFSVALRESEKTKTLPLALVLDLPELSDEEIAANKARLKAMTA